MFVTKFFGLLSVRKLKAITHPTVSVTLLTEEYQTVFTPGTQTSFSTPFIKINVFFFRWPNRFLRLSVHKEDYKKTSLVYQIVFAHNAFILVRSQLSVWLVPQHRVTRISNALWKQNRDLLQWRVVRT